MTILYISLYFLAGICIYAFAYYRGKKNGYNTGYETGYQQGETYGRFNADGLGQLTMIGLVENFLKERKKSLETTNYKREIAPRGRYE